MIAVFFDNLRLWPHESSSDLSYPRAVRIWKAVEYVVLSDLELTLSYGSSNGGKARLPEHLPIFF